jgi:hypothetical protein
MSYADPSKIRKHRVTIYLDDNEQALVEAMKNFDGGELSPRLREMMLEGVRRILHGDDYGMASPAIEGALKALHQR